MAKMFNAEMATFYEKYYADKGVKFIKEDVATGFEGNGKVESKSNHTSDTCHSQKLACTSWRAGHLCKPALMLHGNCLAAHGCIVPQGKHDGLARSPTLAGTHILLHVVTGY